MPPPLPGAATLPKASGVLAGLSVLLIEDDPSIVPLVRTMLRRLGAAAIQEATTGGEGRAAALSGRFDLILCDWRLADGVSGLEVLQSLRAANVGAPFLMMTGLADQASVLAAKEAGVSGYIAKPFSAKDLETKIAAVRKRSAGATAPPTGAGPLRPSDLLRSGRQ